MVENRKRLHIVTLGCSKNVVDSEHIAAHAVGAGWDVLFDQEPEEGDALLLNTCGFIGDAKEESIEYILRAAAKRAEGELSELLVMGCLSQRYLEELRAEIPEVDRWYGVHDNAEILRDLGCQGQAIDWTRRMPSTLRVPKDRRGVQPALRLLRYPQHPWAIHLNATPGAGKRGG